MIETLGLVTALPAGESGTGATQEGAAAAGTADATGRPAAIASERAALDNATGIHGAASFEHALAQRYLGYALADAGRLDEAQVNLHGAIDYFDALVGNGDHPLAASTRLALGEVMARAGKLSDAIATVERGAQQSERLYGAGDTRTKEARSLLANLRAGKTSAATMIAMTEP